MIPIHDYIKDCPCSGCLKIAFAARFGQPMEREIVGAGQQTGNVSTCHEVIGSPHVKGPRSTGYGG